jgi:hypothetical protein
MISAYEDAIPTTGERLAGIPQTHSPMAFAGDCSRDDDTTQASAAASGKRLAREH